MTIEELATAPRSRKAGNWRVWVDENRREIWHYSTRMLVVDSNGEVLDYSTGWGSVTDQQGMNRLFRALDLPLYFRRKGGAEIIETSR
jgi:hypothetical protein